MQISRVTYSTRLGDKAVLLPTSSTEQIEAIFGVHRNRITAIEVLSDTEASFELFKVSEPSQKEVCDLFQALGQLFSLGVDPVGGLNLLIRRAKNVRMAEKLLVICQAIQQGEPIANAFGRYGYLFGETSIHLIRAGAATGNLGRAFESLADNMTKARTISRRVQGALIYPVIVTIAIYIIVCVFLIFVIPQLAQVYDSFKVLAQLPWITKILKDISAFVMRQDVMVRWAMASILPGLGVWAFLEREKIARSKWFNDFLRAMPGLKEFVWKKNLTQVSTTLALLLESGLPLTESLEFSSRVVSDPEMGRIFMEIRARLEEGELVNEAFGNYVDDLGPDGPRLVMAVEVGDATGSLAPLITKIAKSLEEEFDLAAQNLNRILEPMVILMIAGVVGVLVYAVYYPMFTLGYHTMQQMESTSAESKK